ncbi:MAG TPA: hypothetical protein VFQ35_12615 [Polyangiaceae bacterium]|nr:hypothetical protein [Polyangiaceae bacterium]
MTLDPSSLFNDLRDDGGAPVDGQQLLADLQGNILRGYGKPRTLLVFVRFGPDPATNRRWVRDHVLRSEPGLRPASEQLSSAPVQTTFSLSASGLARLGCPSPKLERFSGAFVRGARAEATRRRLDDPPVDAWERAFQKPWDALWLLACDVGALEVQRSIIEHAVRAEAISAALIESGNVLDRQGTPVGPDWTTEQPRFEPFGYRDGISTPVFSQAHLDELALSGKAITHQKRNLSVVLARDPLSSSGFGSYVVFRKLFQDVAGFRRRLDDMVRKLRWRGPELSRVWGTDSSMPYGAFVDGSGAFDDSKLEDFVRQRIMGRSADGTPATLGPSANNPTNDFDYAEDDGRRCPFSAHVRKVCPRGGYSDLASEATHSVVRRGVSFGRADSEADPERGAGLLFMCAQSDIENQFEFVQARWVNDAERDFSAEPLPMRDNIAASGGASRPNGYVQDPESRDDRGVRYAWLTETMEFDAKMYDLVSLRGAEYLFTPSISGLRALCQGGAP